ncbi:MAG: hypothetical protein KAH72_03855 [Flavobacteriaceae bacterium]|nr:hypothetical protein [Flavobacteriaceae bacterium]
MSKNKKLNFEKFQVSKIKNGKNILGGDDPADGGSTIRTSGSTRRPKRTQD